MNKTRVFSIFLFALSASFLVGAQQVQGFVHQRSNSSDYQWPDVPKVLEKLDNWQDAKFGVLFHFGLYSVPGIVESWSICSEDVDWISRKKDLPYDEYKKWYYSLKDSLNPVLFNPDKWASIMDKAGMKYMIFTTKHHDGFCNFPSKYTDFSIANGPFGSDPRSNIAAEVFNAFRKKDFMIGCYFSKPDWHCEWFWNPAYSTPNRHINYKKERHPDWWKNYQDFTSGQLGELLSGDYGKFDILWLDGGWVRGDEVGLDSLLVAARNGIHPGLISVDRTIKGRNENYQTPERGIPETKLDHPWESCITLSNDWGWVPDAPFKSPQKVLAMLVEITAKGGCLLLGVGPTPEGEIESAVEKRLTLIGDWLRKNGKAIYATRPVDVFNSGNVWFTRTKDNSMRFAIIVPAEGSKVEKTVAWRGNVPKGKIIMVENGKSVRYSVVDGDSVIVNLDKIDTDYPVALEFTPRPDVPLYKNKNMPVERRIADLLSKMTLEEKAAQLQCPMGWEMYIKDKNGNVSVSDRFIVENSGGKPVGAYWATLRADPWTRKTLETGLNASEAANALNALQKYAIEETRLGIPIMFHEELPHGLMSLDATVFPTGLGMASTWNPDLIRKAGAAAGEEALARGVSVGYGPVLDIARDPRWSRMEDTMGEDPWLAGEIGAAYMSGMQGANVGNGRCMVSMLKHFAGYGVPESGLNGADATVGMRKLEGELLQPFRKAVSKGAGALMTSYNKIDGIPATGHRYLLNDVLRGKWGFNGFVCSDLFSIDGMVNSTAANKIEAGAKSLHAGVDMDLGAACYGNKLEEAVKAGLVTMEEVDTAVSRILRIKFLTGLFDNPYVDPKKAKQISHTAENRAIAAEIARQGTILLKNDGMLPLNENLKKIAVIGPNADMCYNQLGDYTAPQHPDEVVTVLEGIKKAVSSSTEVIYAKGCAVRDTLSSDIFEAVKAAEASDAVILVVGGSSARDFKTSYASTGAATTDNTNNVLDMDCGEGFDRSTLDLLGAQNELMEAILATGKPVVVVYIQGRPLDMNLPADKASALLCAWYPGERGGEAIADIIFGKYNPSGRLPVTVPRSVGQLPVYYSQGTQHDYMDGKSAPLFPFGYGLSYSTFKYSNLEIRPEGDNRFEVSCNVTNTGERDGAEVVQLYISDPVASVARPSLMLKGFSRVELKKGETKNVEFILGPEELSFLGIDMKEHLEPGKINLMIGPSSADFRLRGSFDVK